MSREKMTIDEAMAIIRKEYLCVDRDCDIEKNCGKCDLMIPSKEPILEAYNMAIKALEQEPKTGHWIETAEEYYKAVNEYGGGVNEDTPYFVDDIACSVCLAKYSVIDNETERFDCCPSCGVKLVEPQERSNKE